MAKKPDNIIRRYDTIEILPGARFFKRCGYPIVPSEIVSHGGLSSPAFSLELIELVNKHLTAPHKLKHIDKRVLNDIAYCVANDMHFGGNKRQIFEGDPVPDRLIGVPIVVSSAYHVMTGERGYDSEYDEFRGRSYSWGVFFPEKRHKILELDLCAWKHRHDLFDSNHIVSIESRYVKKVTT